MAWKLELEAADNFKHGKYDQAERLFRTAALYWIDGGLVKGLANALTNTKKYQELEKCPEMLKTGYVSDEERWDVLILAADAAIRLGHPRQAHDFLTQALSLIKRNSSKLAVEKRRRLSSQVADLFFVLEEQATAERIVYEADGKFSPWVVQTLAEERLRRYGFADVDRWLETLERRKDLTLKERSHIAVEKIRYKREALLRLVNDLNRHGHFSESLRRLKSALAFGYDERILLLIADTSFRTKNYLQAYSACQSVLAANSDSTHGLWINALSAASLNKIDEAINSFSALVDQGEHLEEALQDRAAMYLLKDNQEAAQADLCLIQARFPEKKYDMLAIKRIASRYIHDFSSLVRLAGHSNSRRTALRLKKIDDELACSSLKERRASLLLAKSEAELELEQYAKALSDVDKATGAGQDSIKAHQVRAAALLGLGLLNQARQERAQVVRLFNNSKKPGTIE